VVVSDLYIVRISIPPNETNTIPIVDPYAVLPLPDASQCLETVAGNRRKIAKRRCPVQMDELAERGPFEELKPPHAPLVKQVLGVRISKGLNQALSYIGIR
jgi:hypothetical protein